MQLFRIRKSHLAVLYKKGVLKTFATFTGKHMCRSLLSNKAVSRKPGTLLKRDSGAGYLLSILQNFQKHLFRRAPAPGYFCKIY